MINFLFYTTCFLIVWFAIGGYVFHRIIRPDFQNRKEVKLGVFFLWFLLIVFWPMVLKEWFEDSNFTFRNPLYKEPKEDK